MRPRILAAVFAALVAAGALLIMIHCRSAQHGEQEEQVSPIVSVRVVPIVRATLHDYVTGWGTIEPEPATPHGGPASARIAAPVAGLLAEVRCAEGQRVSRSAILFVLDARVADVALAKAGQAVRFAEAAFERQKALGPGEATSQRQYQEAEQSLAAARNDLAAADAQRRLLEVRAPLSGAVVKVNARPGDAIDPTTVLAEVIDLGRLVVSIPVRTSDIAKVRPGQNAILAPRGAAAGAADAQQVRGRVVFVGAAVDGKTDTVTVRASVPADAGLRPGQFLDIQIVTAEHPCLAAPLEGLVTEDGTTTLAVVEGGRAVKRPVRAGLREGPLVEVEGEGLREGLSVVADGAYGLPKETRVRVIEH